MSSCTLQVTVNSVDGLPVKVDLLEKADYYVEVTYMDKTEKSGMVKNCVERANFHQTFTFTHQAGQDMIKFDVKSAGRLGVSKTVAANVFRIQKNEAGTYLNYRYTGDVALVAENKKCKRPSINVSVIIA